MELIEEERMARWWRVWYGGVGGEDEAGMSIDSGCMRLKPPFVATTTTTTAARGLLLAVIVRNS